MNKLLIALCVISAVATAQAVVLAWNITDNPQGRTVQGITLGAVSKIVIVDGGSATSVTAANRGSMATLFSSNASYTQDPVSEDNMVMTANGKTQTGAQSYTAGNNYFILVYDDAGQFFASNPLAAYTSDGWQDSDTSMPSPNPEWTPNFYESAATGLIGVTDSVENGWVTAVPEPTSFALMLIGAGCLWMRRRKLMK